MLLTIFIFYWSPFIHRKISSVITEVWEQEIWWWHQVRVALGCWMIGCGEEKWCKILLKILFVDKLLGNKLIITEKASFRPCCFWRHNAKVKGSWAEEVHVIIPRIVARWQLQCCHRKKSLPWKTYTPVVHVGDIKASSVFLQMIQRVQSWEHASTNVYW